MVRDMPQGNLWQFRDMFDGLQQSQVILAPYTTTLAPNLPRMCVTGIHSWASRVPLISWKRVEWHLPDRVMRQFGCIQSIEIEGVPRDFERIDGRGRADKDWTQEHAPYIALWNTRHQRQIQLTRPEGDGSAELRTYLRWYRSWASIYLLQPSVLPPTTYRVNAPTERHLLDYYHRSYGLITPFADETDPSTFYDMSAMVSQVRDLAQQVEGHIYIDYTSQERPPPPRRPAPAPARRSTSSVPRRTTTVFEAGEPSVVVTPAAQSSSETETDDDPDPETVPATQSPEQPQRPIRERRSPTRFTFSWKKGFHRRKR